MGNAPRENAFTRYVLRRGLRAKILLIVAVLCFGAAVQGAVALGELGSLNGGARDIYRTNLVPTSHLSDVRASVGAVEAAVLAMPTSSTSQQREELRTTAAEADQRLDATIKAYTGTVASQRQHRLVAQFTTAWQRFRNVRDAQLYPRAQAGQRAQFESLFTNVATPAIAAAQQALLDLVSYEVATGKQAATNIADRYGNAQTIIWIVIALVLGAGVAMGYALARMIVTPIRQISAMFGRVAAGDLTCTVEVKGHDEITSMARGLQQALTNLRLMITTVSAGATDLDAHSGELASTNATIATAAAHTSTQANEVAASAEDVTTYVSTMALGANEITQSIHEISRSATEAATVAGQAVHLADETKTTVSKLGDSSTRIGKVVEMITTIAEQTNLLALNATIEAARAGAAGKGFAVVAAEVKDLAQETAKATDEITRLVGDIQHDTAGAVLASGQISEIIATIDGYQTTIASAVEQQNATTTELSKNVAQAAASSARISQQISVAADDARATSAGATEARRATENLSGLAGNLRQAVSQFRV